MLLLERHPADNPVKRLFESQDKKNVGLAIEMVCNSSIIDDCYAIALDYSSRAKGNLELLPESPVQQVLSDLADFVIERKE